MREEATPAASSAIAGRGAATAASAPAPANRLQGRESGDVHLPNARCLNPRAGVQTGIINMQQEQWQSRRKRPRRYPHRRRRQAALPPKPANQPGASPSQQAPSGGGSIGLLLLRGKEECVVPWVAALQQQQQPPCSPNAPLTCCCARTTVLRGRGARRGPAAAAGRGDQGRCKGHGQTAGLRAHKSVPANGRATMAPVAARCSCMVWCCQVIAARARGRAWLDTH